MAGLRKPKTLSESLVYMVYGPSGVGKTSLADDPGFISLVINAAGEDGDAVLSHSEHCFVYDVNSWQELIDVYKGLQKGELPDEDGKPVQLSDLGINNVMLDSLGRLQELCKDYILQLAPDTRRPVKGIFGAQQDWGLLRDRFLNMVKAFHSLAKQKKFHLGLIAHSKEVQDENGMILIRPALQGGDTPEIVMAMTDATFFMYKKKDEEGNVRRYFITDADGKVFAKHRKPKTAPALPLQVEDPQISRIIKYLSGETTEL